MWYQTLLEAFIKKIKFTEQGKEQDKARDLITKFCSNQLLILCSNKIVPIGLILGIIEKLHLKFAHLEDGSVDLAVFAKYFFELYIVYTKAHDDVSVFISDISESIEPFKDILNWDNEINKYKEKINSYSVELRKPKPEKKDVKEDVKEGVIYIYSKKYKLRYLMKDGEFFKSGFIENIPYRMRTSIIGASKNYIVPEVGESLKKENAKLTQEQEKSIFDALKNQAEIYLMKQMEMGLLNEFFKNSEFNIDIKLHVIEKLLLSPDTDWKFKVTAYYSYIFIKGKSPEFDKLFKKVYDAIPIDKKIIFNKVFAIFEAFNNASINPDSVNRLLSSLNNFFNAVLQTETNNKLEDILLADAKDKAMQSIYSPYVMALCYNQNFDIYSSLDRFSAFWLSYNPLALTLVEKVSELEKLLCKSDEGFTHYIYDLRMSINKLLLLADKSFNIKVLQDLLRVDIKSKLDTIVRAAEKYLTPEITLIIKRIESMYASYPNVPDIVPIEKSVKEPTSELVILTTQELNKLKEDKILNELKNIWQENSLDRQENKQIYVMLLEKYGSNPAYLLPIMKLANTHNINLYDLSVLKALKSGKTIAHYAAEYADMNTMNELYKRGMYFFAKDSAGIMAFELFENNPNATINHSFPSGIKPGETLLEIALRVDNKEAVEKLAPSNVTLTVAAPNAANAPLQPVTIDKKAQLSQPFSLVLVKLNTYVSAQIIRVNAAEKNDKAESESTKNLYELVRTEIHTAIENADCNLALIRELINQLAGITEDEKLPAFNIRLFSPSVSKTPWENYKKCIAEIVNDSLIKTDVALFEFFKDIQDTYQVYGFCQSDYSA